jgi:hypothetical protein
MRRIYLGERGVPRKLTRDVELVPVRTIQHLMQRLFT